MSVPTGPGPARAPLAGRRVLVVGLGETGASVVRWAAGAGAQVTVVEDRPGGPGYAERAAAARALRARVVERPAPAGWAELVADADLVVPSPGVRPTHAVYRRARELGVRVRGDVDLAVEAARAPVIAVTGTNGKSTVTTLAAAMLAASDVRARAAGNIGWPLLDALGPPADALVAEVSSFQLHATSGAFAPAVAVLLNVAEDHLDWHGSFAAYVDAKRRVFAHQHEDQVLVANVDDPVVRELAPTAPGRVIACSIDDAEGADYRLERGALVGPHGMALARVDDLPMRAPHDLANALAAAAASLELGATVEGIRSALVSARRLHHRIEPIGQAGGVTFVDDSKATNPHATLSALAAFDRPVLIVGGRNKGVDLGAALRPARDRVCAVVAIGEAAAEIGAAFGGHVRVTIATSMRDAVRAAAELAAPGGTVLLAPACASFDWYSSYEERGAAFAREVAALAAERETVGR